ncbi:hypothetical protein [Chlamydia vaughanii]|uniref:hypothetical protein n=1 Tax=Chlamydia vaughanii TaxID=3112552 RepID=UPI0032B15BEB
MVSTNLTVSDNKLSTPPEQPKKPSKSVAVGEIVAALTSVLFIVIGALGIAAGTGGALFIAGTAFVVLGAVALVLLASVALVTSIKSSQGKKKLEVKPQETPALIKNPEPSLKVSTESEASQS